MSAGGEKEGVSCFQAAVPLYLDSGLGYPLPLPAGRKQPPPRGYTGSRGRRPSKAQFELWRQRQPSDANVALVLAEGLVALDIDAYSGKQGERTLRQLEAGLGRVSEGERDRRLMLRG